MDAFELFLARNVAHEGKINGYDMLEEVADNGDGYCIRQIVLTMPGHKLRMPRRYMSTAMDVIAHLTAFGIPVLDPEEDIIVSEEFGAAIRAFPDMEPAFFMYNHEAHAVRPDRIRSRSTEWLESNIGYVRTFACREDVATPAMCVVDPIRNLESYSGARMWIRGMSLVERLGLGRTILKRDMTASGCGHVICGGVFELGKALETFSRMGHECIAQAMVGDCDISLTYYLDEYRGPQFLFSTDQVMKKGSGGNVVHDGNDGMTIHENSFRQRAGNAIMQTAFEMGVRGFAGTDGRAIYGQIGTEEDIECNIRPTGPTYSAALAHKLGQPADRFGNRNVKTGVFQNIAGLIPPELLFSPTTGKGTVCFNPNFHENPNEGMATVAYFGTREERGLMHIELQEHVAKASGWNMREAA